MGTERSFLNVSLLAEHGRPAVALMEDSSSTALERILDCNAEFIELAQANVAFGFLQQLSSVVFIIALLLLSLKISDRGKARASSNKRPTRFRPAPHSGFRTCHVPA
jgi:hypothetical protein